MMSSSQTSRQQVLSLYRQLLRTARDIPSYNHRGLALQKTRTAFRSASTLTNPQDIQFSLSLGETQLDNLRAQQSHMKETLNKEMWVRSKEQGVAIMQQAAAAANQKKASFHTWAAQVNNTHSTDYACNTSSSSAHNTNTTTNNISASSSSSSSSSVFPSSAMQPLFSSSMFTRRPLLAKAAPTFDGEAIKSSSSKKESTSTTSATTTAASTTTPAATSSTPDAEQAEQKSNNRVPSRNVETTAANHIIHLRLSPNNTIATLTDLKGDTLAWASGGTVGFKNSRKSTYVSTLSIGETVAKKARALGIEYVNLHIAGLNKNKKAVLKGILKAGLNVSLIKDTTPIPFNGCKPKKQRRL